MTNRRMDEKSEFARRAIDGDASGVVRAPVGCCVGLLIGGVEGARAGDLPVLLLLALTTVAATDVVEGTVAVVVVFSP